LAQKKRSGDWDKKAIGGLAQKSDRGIGTKKDALLRVTHPTIDL
jgi:hypothetical protein